MLKSLPRLSGFGIRALGVSTLFHLFGLVRAPGSGVQAYSPGLTLTYMLENHGLRFRV